ncbi:hypothetical protein llap_4006 [Limosa lapponica baueri]|uniref:Uncharacterized protein n=1 Tax=Limosa lapponica baueri TaxID=1758121 RepID=A0A2I0UHZ8_LIMLA|nr:hypothetical protein llap_4006 [Limosa lapponica baueri]
MILKCYTRKLFEIPDFFSSAYKERRGKERRGEERQGEVRRGEARRGEARCGGSPISGCTDEALVSIRSGPLTRPV